jgi:hypothetical protein
MMACGGDQLTTSKYRTLLENSERSHQQHTKKLATTRQETLKDTNLRMNYTWMQIEEQSLFNGMKICKF